MVITIITYFIIAMLAATKLLDVLSTLAMIRNTDNETNPFARGLMKHLGPGKTVWLVFILALAIISIAGFAALRGGLIMQIAFIAVGLAVSVIQGAVAFANWTGAENFITRQVRAFYSTLGRRFSTRH